VTQHLTATRACRALALVLLIATASCSKKGKTEPMVADSRLHSSEATAATYTPGEAGGTVQDTFTATATVAAVDVAKRKVTLTGDDGKKVSFEAPAEVRNLDQLRVGDKVTATVTETMTVFVARDRERAASHTAALATAPKGAKPGAIAAEVFEVAATVTAIDSAKREATLKFADGKPLTVRIRPDVDLTRYKTGDSVVIQVTQQLALLVDKP
jgi:Cu/Ag efflux protein CusF